MQAYVRGIKFQKKQIPNSKKGKYDVSFGELNPKPEEIKYFSKWLFKKVGLECEGHVIEQIISFLYLL